MYIFKDQYFLLLLFLLVTLCWPDMHLQFFVSFSTMLIIENHWIPRSQLVLYHITAINQLVSVNNLKDYIIGLYALKGNQFCRHDSRGACDCLVPLWVNLRKKWHHSHPKRLDSHQWMMDSNSWPAKHLGYIHITSFFVQFFFFLLQSESVNILLTRLYLSCETPPMCTLISRAIVLNITWF